ncbi:MAG: hypothetical protein PHT88_01040 [Candidatus Moranbacteria bacterium]|nr:hypothetical protein [Candidatus Moranbacteria bacterium]
MNSVTDKKLFFVKYHKVISLIFKIVFLGLLAMTGYSCYTGGWVWSAIVLPIMTFVVMLFRIGLLLANGRSVPGVRGVTAAATLLVPWLIVWPILGAAPAAILGVMTLLIATWMLFVAFSDMMEDIRKYCL